MIALAHRPTLSLVDAPRMPVNVHEMHRDGVGLQINAFPGYVATYNEPEFALIKVILKGKPYISRFGCLPIENRDFLLGYAGSAPGQLEQELTNNGWLTLPANYNDIFSTEDEFKWKKVAARNGIDIALFGDIIGNA